MGDYSWAILYSWVITLGLYSTVQLGDYFLIPEKCLVFIFSYMYIACVKYLQIFTMARHYEHRPIFNIGHITLGENENYTFYGNKVCIFSYDIILQPCFTV